MKLLLKIIFAAFGACVLLSSCAKEKDLKALEKRVASIEGSTEVSTLSNQVSSMESSVSSLKTVEESLTNEVSSLKTKLEELEQNPSSCDCDTEIAAVKTKIESLNSAITELQTRISGLESTVESLKGIQDWVKGTYVTLEEYNRTCETLASVKAITDNLDSKIQDIVAAADASTRSWVNDQLTAYSTIAQTDAKIAALKEQIETELSSQKSELEGKISSLRTELSDRISSNETAMESLKSDIQSLSLKDKALEDSIKANATSISINAGKISSNSTQISANSEAISRLAAGGTGSGTGSGSGSGSSSSSDALAVLVNGNRTLINQNSTLIAANTSAISSLSTKIADNTDSIDKNTASIAQNASDIAKNASKISELSSLVSSSATAIANNSTAISDNAKEIAQLRTDLASMKEEVTTSYKNAISTAITTSEGKFDSKIQDAVSSVNSTISTEIDRVNSAISALTTRVDKLESDMSAISTSIDNLKKGVEELITMVQSVTVIPQYNDGSVAITDNNSSAPYIKVGFEIYPLETAQSLAVEGIGSFSIKAVGTATKASASIFNLPVTAVSYSDGVVTILADAASLGSTILKGNATASARLLISSGKNSVTSGYFPLYAPVKGGSIEDTQDEDLGSGDIAGTVDMGLGVLWATCNLGASSPEEYGDYYAWGEISAYGEAPSAYPSDFVGTQNSNYLGLSVKSGYSYTPKYYKYCEGSNTTMTRYCTSSDYGSVDGRSQLLDEDDAVVQKKGGHWRMPTKSEWESLLNLSTCTWTTQNGVNGLLITSLVSGYTDKSIFLPAAGYCTSSGLVEKGSKFGYWSRSLYESNADSAWSLSYDGNNFRQGNSARALGLSIRPVYVKY